MVENPPESQALACASADTILLGKFVFPNSTIDSCFALARSLCLIPSRRSSVVSVSRSAMSVSCLSSCKCTEPVVREERTTSTARWTPFSHGEAYARCLRCFFSCFERAALVCEKRFEMDPKTHTNYGSVRWFDCGNIVLSLGDCCECYVSQRGKPRDV